MTADAKKVDAVLGGVALLFLITLLYSCFSGGEEVPPGPAEAEVAASPVAAVQPPPTAEEQKQAEDFVKLTINMSGFLCAQIVDVKPAGGANLFAIQCVERRDGTGSAIYLYDGDRKKASRL